MIWSSKICTKDVLFYFIWGCCSQQSTNKKKVTVVTMFFDWFCVFFFTNKRQALFSLFWISVGLDRSLCVKIYPFRGVEGRKKTIICRKESCLDISFRPPWLDPRFIDWSTNVVCVGSPQHNVHGERQTVLDVSQRKSHYQTEREVDLYACNHKKLICMYVVKKPTPRCPKHTALFSAACHWPTCKTVDPHDTVCGAKKLKIVSSVVGRVSKSK